MINDIKLLASYNISVHLFYVQTDIYLKPRTLTHTSDLYNINNSDCSLVKCYGKPLVMWKWSVIVLTHRLTWINLLQVNTTRIEMLMLAFSGYGQWGTLKGVANQKYFLGFVLNTVMCLIWFSNDTSFRWNRGFTCYTN